MYTKRYLTVMLAAMMLLASCGQSASGSADTTAAGGTDTTAAEETTSYLDEIPRHDLGGSEFRMAVHSASDRPNIHAGEQNGDVINDALFMRDQNVEELYNTKIVTTVFAGRGDISKEINTMVTAGEDAYDVIITSLNDGIGKMGANGLLADMASIDAIDFDKPWWNAYATEALSWNGKIIGSAGPIALCYSYGPFAFFANLSKANDFGLENLYKVVDDGKWTIDYMNNAMKNVAQDVDSDGEYTVKDNFGLALTIESGHAFLVGCGQKMAEKTGDSVKFLLEDTKTVEVMDKIHNIMSQDGVIVTDNLGENKEGTGLTSYKVLLFTNSQTLFTATPLQYGVLSFRDMKDDYALLPFPKYDEAQKEYNSYLTSLLPVGTAIPKTNTRLQETGAIMEYMCYYSYSEIQPKISSVVLKEKIARDEDSKSMFDIVYGNIRIDVNHVFNLGSTGNLVRSYVSGDKDNFASSYASAKSAAEEALATLLENLAE